MSNSNNERVDINPHDRYLSADSFPYPVAAYQFIFQILNYYYITRNLSQISGLSSTDFMNRFPLGEGTTQVQQYTNTPLLKYHGDRTFISLFNLFEYNVVRTASIFNTMTGVVAIQDSEIYLNLKEMSERYCSSRLGPSWMNNMIRSHFFNPVRSVGILRLPAAFVMLYDVKQAERTQVEITAQIIEPRLLISRVYTCEDDVNNNRSELWINRDFFQPKSSEILQNLNTSIDLRFRRRLQSYLKTLIVSTENSIISYKSDMIMGNLLYEINGIDMSLKFASVEEMDEFGHNAITQGLSSIRTQSGGL